MANNYTQFSSALADLKPEELARLMHQLETDEFTLPDGNIYEFSRFIAEVYRPDEWADNDFDGFDATFYAHECYLSAEESGDIEHVALFVQLFLRQFRPDDCWAMEYANTCDKPRADEFGGGACFVTATSIQWMSTSEWVQQKTEEFNKAKVTQ